MVHKKISIYVYWNFKEVKLQTLICQIYKKWLNIIKILLKKLLSFYKEVEI